MTVNVKLKAVLSSHSDIPIDDAQDSLFVHAIGE